MGQYILASLGLLAVALSLGGTGADVLCPYDWVSHNDSCYKLFTRWMSWDDAQRTCQEAQENGQLASIKDVEGAAKLSKYLRENRRLRLDAWIGLRLSKINNKWEWSDGSNVTYVSWEKGQPDNFLKLEFCAVVSSKSQFMEWNDKPCGFPHRFVCKFQPRRVASSG
ncbi:C-type lectin lectoxin-Phi1-like [Thamnophis elegans]|uniref:C-type lectin lectoxin-Phi1-like n=1 Tax=Thamnophis elegans TaxID=35005 RepID=UPI001377C1E9|nr:C-type lectin lectoxin-Phi1-like [Thamnophis elegans]